MISVTLLLTRFPHDEFIFDDSAATSSVNNDDVDRLSDDQRKALYRTAGRSLDKPANRTRVSGMWGTMAMLVGPAVTYASLHNASVVPLKPTERAEVLDFANRSLYLTLEGKDIDSFKEFTTMERYRTDSGYVDKWDIGFVRMVSRPAPYGLYTEVGNKVVMTLPYEHDGSCIRITGGGSDQQKAILLHDVPHAGYVIGCISPRPLGDHSVYPYDPRNPSRLAMLEIMGIMKNKAGNKGQLYVLQN